MLHYYYAKASGLERGAVYDYTVGNKEYDETAVFQFESKRNFVAGGKPAKFLVYGDLGTGPETTATLAMLKKEVE